MKLQSGVGFPLLAPKLVFVPGVLAQQKGQDGAGQARLEAGFQCS
jgi:hypothetical protein